MQKLRRCKQEKPLRDGLWIAVDAERSRVQKRQTEYDHRHPRAAQCALAPARATSDPAPHTRRAVRPLGGARRAMRGKAGESAGAFAAPVRSQPPAVRAVSETEADAFLRADIFD